MGNVAATYRNQGRWDEAEKLEMDVMNARTTMLESNHPDALNSMANLTHLINAQILKPESGQDLPNPTPIANQSPLSNQVHPHTVWQDHNPPENMVN